MLLQKLRRIGKLQRIVLHAATARKERAKRRHPARNAAERRLAPIGSSRYSTFSCFTGVIMGIPAASSSGKLARIALARGHHSAHSRRNIVRALVAEHLQRHPRNRLAFPQFRHFRILGRRHLARQRRSKSRPSPDQSPRTQYRRPSPAVPLPCTSPIYFAHAG